MQISPATEKNISPRQAATCRSPRQVNIELTSACNYSCRHCAVSMPDYRAKTMPRKLAFRIVDDLAQFKPAPEFIQLSGHGESTILPWFAELVNYIRNRFPDAYVNFHTNGSRLLQLADFLVNRNCKCLAAVSVDGGSAATFDYMRGVGAYDRLVSGLREIARIKLERGSSFPELGFACVLTNRMAHELPLIVKLAAEVGARYVTLQPLTVYTELKTEELLMAKIPEEGRAEIIEKAQQAQTLAQQHGIGFSLLQSDIFNEPRLDFKKIPSKPPASGGVPSELVQIGEHITPHTRLYRQCMDPWRMLFINVLGGINTCCYRFNDISETLHTHTLEEIWYGSAGFSRVRSSLLSGNLDGVCKECPTRPWGEKPPTIP